VNLRPQTLEDFVGQENLKPLIMAAISKTKTNNKLWPNTLLFGPSGVGKTTLARIICNEIGYIWTSITASKELTPPMLRRLLLNLDCTGYGAGGVWQPGAKKHMIFIDEVAELKLSVWESVLYNATEDLQVYDESGTIYWLPDLAVICGTTAPYVLPSPALGRLRLQLHLQPYSVADLVAMIRRIYPHMTPDIAKEVAQRSRGIARLALNYADGVNDHGLTWFDVLGVNSQGLNELDLSYLAVLTSANGKGMSLNSIANVVRESPKTLAAFVEPELLRLGMIEINAQGRTLCGEGRGPKIRD